MDTFAAMAIASLPPNPEVMLEKPRPRDEFIITPGMARTLFICGGIMVAVLLGMLFWWTITEGGLTVRQLTLFFSTFVFLQFWNMFNAKGFETRHSVLHDLRGSRTFFLVLLLIAVGQVLIVEFGGPVFRTTPLTWVQWLEVIGYTSLIAILGDVVRSIRRRIRPRPGCR
jgi:Ca2+-transporting ATPase